MFGYVRPLKGELKVREYEMYQAVYCGLCRAMKRRYGKRSTLLLNYDLTFLAVLLLALGSEQGYVYRRCISSPIKRKCMCAPSAPLETCAGFAVILGCEKLRDDIQDAGFWHSVFCRAALLFFRKAERRADKNCPTLKQDVDRSLAELELLEAERSPVMDAAAETFAAILSSAGNEVKGEKGEHLRKLLYHVGRWIYIVDAADDLKQDMEDGSYNAVAQRFGIEDGVITQEVREYLHSTMDLSTGMAADEALEMDLGKYTGLVDNILEKGLPFVARKVLKGEWSKKDRKNFKRKP